MASPQGRPQGGLERWRAPESPPLARTPVTRCRCAPVHRDKGRGIVSTEPEVDGLAVQFAVAGLCVGRRVRGGGVWLKPNPATPDDDHTTNRLFVSFRLIAYSLGSETCRRE